MESTQLDDAEAFDHVNKAIRPLVLVMSTVLAGCSTIEVNHDFDPKANFAALKT